MAAESTHTEEPHDDHHGGLLADTSFWVGGSFIAFVLLLVYLKVHKTIGAALDKRSQTIADQIEEARKLKEDAQRLLAEYERKNHEAEEQSKKLIATAREDAKAMAANARSEVTALIDRRTKAVEEKIVQARESAVRELEAHAAKLSVDIASRYVEQEADALPLAGLLDEAVAKVGQRLN